MNRVTLLILTFLTITACTPSPTAATEEDAAPPRVYIYDIDCTDHEVVRGEVQRGETAGKIFDRYGVSAAQIDRIARVCRDTFDLRKIRVGGRYTVLLSGDSTARHLDHFVYEKNITDYVTISLIGDSVVARNGHKDVRVERHKSTATISSSLWNSITEAGMPISLAVDLEEIYGWSVDFFGLQAGDNFTVIYEKQFVDSVCIGSGRVWGAVFNHGGKELYAIPFRQGEKITYWDEKGNSLRKLLLKAPLKYSRISSRFSHARLHPVHRVYRPHYGVDYAAPKGTPVYAIADGTVIFKGWGGGGGNTLKIKHPRNLTSGYLHLSGFAKGIATGVRVSQGQLIGYVGSTGTSTGPHLDFRLWKGGKPIDPLKAPSEPVEPIKQENRPYFEWVCDMILSELGDSLSGREPLVQLDSMVIKTTNNDLATR
ncbi:MAG: peptidoglycan DD-metalloendopeptidase family protein [Rikenellaceae bacterium]|nr:peptidoglycan DD-metalloendopeptidase family protein [Rikenellaceae bacterium]